MSSLANTRDSSLSTTSGAAIAKGTRSSALGTAPTGWSLPVGFTPLTIGVIGAIGLLVYLDRRVVFK
jgi:hypothetical protein